MGTMCEQNCGCTTCQRASDEAAIKAAKRIVNALHSDADRRFRVVAMDGRGLDRKSTAAPFAGWPPESGRFYAQEPGRVARAPLARSRWVPLRAVALALLVFVVGIAALALLGVYR